MHVADNRMMASVGSTIFGSSRSSTRTSPGPCITTPRMIFSAVRCLPCCRSVARGGVNLGDVRVDRAVGAGDHVQAALDVAEDDDARRRDGLAVLAVVDGE